MGPENDREDDYDEYGFGANDLISRIVKRRVDDIFALKVAMANAINPFGLSKEKAKAEQLRYSAAFRVDKNVSETAYSLFEIRKILATSCYDTRGYLEDTGLFSFENFTLFRKTLQSSSAVISNNWALVVKIIQENDLTINELERLHLIATLSERANTPLDMVGVPTSYLYKLALQVPTLV